MKARTMVYLEPEQLRALRREAQSRGISLAELMRRLVDEHLSRGRLDSQAPVDVYMRIVALGESGSAEVAEEHDRHLAEALHREHSR